VMFSPNHPTFDIEDAFSSNSPNYTLASPDYSPASPGNTPFESLNNSYGLEILPPKKLGRERSSSSTSALSQAFKMGESSHKTSLEHHEEQIEEVLNHLDELSLDRIEHIEDKIKGLGNAPAMTQATIRQLVADNVVAALEAQAANMTNTDNTNRNTEPKETLDRTESIFSPRNCIKDCKVKFATGTPTEDALSWWNSYAKPTGMEQANKIT
nr:reverse transcriptase domain-containing protein [Tanacetum cinerariifolium]